MFPRIKSFKNKDGTYRHYLFLVQTKRIAGRIRQVTVANFGRLEDADKVLPDVVEKLAKFSKTLKVINLSKQMSNDWVKEYGVALIFKKIWEKLELDKYFAKTQYNKKTTFNIGELIWGMVINRLVEPGSELSTQEWLKGIYGIKEVKDITRLYRSLDFLIRHKDGVEKYLYESRKDLFNQDLDMVLMDTTSVVYFGEGEKAQEILDYGYSKAKRFDLKQVIVGVLMTKDGIPIAHEVYPGNTNDVKAFKSMISAVKEKFNIRRVIIVCDRGMISETNIEALEVAGYEYIVGMRMRQLKREKAEKILSKADMNKLSTSLSGKEVRYEGRRLVVCFNPEEAIKDKTKREEIISRLTEKLKTQGLKSLLVHREYSKYLKIKAEKPEIDEAKIETEELFDGKFILQSNTKFKWQDIILAYKGLWQIEACFRTLKSELEMGPIYHFTERRIRAHVFICFLSLVLKIVFQKELFRIDKSASVNKVLADVRKIKAVQITLKDTPIVLRTELEGDAYKAFKAVGLKIPTRILNNPADTHENVVVRL